MVVEEILVLRPENFHEISMKTGISQAELDLRYMGAMERNEYLLFHITTSITTERKRRPLPEKEKS